MTLLQTNIVSKATGKGTGLHVTMRNRLVVFTAHLAALVALFITTTALSLAQSPPINGLAHVAISVADVKASRAFYQKLGFEEFFAFEKDGVISQSFLKVNDRQFIELYPVSTHTPIGFLHLCFEGDDLNALHQFNVDAGLTPISVRKAGAGNLLFTQRGPEDQNIEYTQYLPGSRHSQDRGKHLGPHRISDNLFAVGLSMKDIPAALAFYTQKLQFPTVPGHPNLLRIPGPSQQQILFEPYTGTQAYLFFSVPHLRHTKAQLKHLGIPFVTGKNQITISDPDGNLLTLKQDRTNLTAD